MLEALKTFSNKPCLSHGAWADSLVLLITLLLSLMLLQDTLAVCLLAHA